jgi:hypothetical protein
MRLSLDLLQRRTTGPLHEEMVAPKRDDHGHEKGGR